MCQLFFRRVPRWTSKPRMLIRSWKTTSEHTYDMQQNDWVNYLSDAEFAVNNYENASISITPFFADHSYHPPRIFSSTTPEKAELVRVNKIIQKQEVSRKLLVDHITWAQTYNRVQKVIDRVDFSYWLIYFKLVQLNTSFLKYYKNWKVS